MGNQLMMRNDEMDGSIARTRDMRNIYTVLVGKLKGKRGHLEDLDANDKEHLNRP
jgi:hypothetical protein